MPPKSKAPKMDYRRLKKQLNKYHEFSFRMPRKGKDFSPQQKSAITRQYKKLGLDSSGKFKDSLLGKESRDLISFVPTHTKLDRDQISKLEVMEKTNKGFFFKYPNAELKIDKKTRQPMVKVKFGVRNEIYFPFPESVKRDFELMEDFVRDLEKRYKFNYVRWSVNGFMGSTQFSIETIFLYMQEKSDEDLEVEEAARIANKPYYTGVFIGYDPNIDL